MRKLLLIILSFFIMAGTAGASDLSEKIINHPDAFKIGEDGYRIAIEENISNTEYKWRWDLRVIESWYSTITIVHRRYQDSGNMPESSWVIEDIFVDYLRDGVLDYFIRDRFILVRCGETEDCKIDTTWPAGFNYPQDRVDEKTQKELFKDELEYWQNKLQ